MDINEYINTNLNDKIQRRGNSPLIPVILAVAGIATLVAAYTAGMADTVQTTLLTIGFILATVGVVWAVLCFANVLWHYQYLPSSSPMRDTNIYLSSDDFRAVTDMLEKGHTDLPSTLSPVISSNTVLHIVYSRDMSIALLQTGRLETSRLEPASPVVVLTGADTNNISALIH